MFYIHLIPNIHNHKIPKIQYHQIHKTRTQKILVQNNPQVQIHNTKFHNKLTSNLKVGIFLQIQIHLIKNKIILYKMVAILLYKMVVI